MFENFLSHNLDEINRGLIKLAKMMVRRRLEDSVNTKYGFVPSQAAMSSQFGDQDMGMSMPAGGGMPMESMPMDMSQQVAGEMGGVGQQIDPSMLSQVMSLDPASLGIDPSSLGLGMGLTASSSPISAMTPETIASAVVRELKKSTEEEGKSKGKSKIDLNSAIQTISQDIYQIKRLLVNLYTAYDIPMPPDILDDPNRGMTVSASDNRHQKPTKIGHPFSHSEARKDEEQEMESLSDTASAVADLIRRIRGNNNK